jgi:hypothetical protein
MRARATVKQARWQSAATTTARITMRPKGDVFEFVSQIGLEQRKARR